MRHHINDACAVVFVAVFIFCVATGLGGCKEVRWENDLAPPAESPTLAFVGQCPPSAIEYSQWADKGNVGIGAGADHSTDPRAYCDMLIAQEELGQ